MPARCVRLGIFVSKGLMVTMVDDPLHPHSHDPNPEPPSADPTLLFVFPDELETQLGVDDLNSLPQTEIADCYIVSTGHGTSGPFRFAGPTLATLLADRLAAGCEWRAVEIVSGDGFGTRVLAEEIGGSEVEHPILLATQIDGAPMERNAGLVRLIVPTEKDDALRQVKWIAEIRVKNEIF